MYFLLGFSKIGIQKRNLEEAVYFVFGKHQVALGVLGMLIMGRALPVWAAETADGNVQEIVITANRMENKKVDTPANVSLVSSEDLTNWNSRSVADALENVPGVRVVRNGLGTNGANVYLRGRTGPFPRGWPPRQYQYGEYVDAGDL